MCLAIYKPIGKSVSKEHLQEGWRMNKDGAGFCYVYRKKLHILKGYFDFKSFYESYSQVEHLPMLIHFRLATHGAKDAMNCHPWQIDERHAMIHNGILSNPSTKEISDTGWFTQNILIPLFKESPNLWMTMPGHYLIEETIGQGNKVLIMNNKGHVEIYNEEAGHWKDGVWFSNYSYTLSGGWVRCGNSYIRNDEFPCDWRGAQLDEDWRTARDRSANGVPDYTPKSAQASAKVIQSTLPEIRRIETKLVPAPSASGFQKTVDTKVASAAAVEFSSIQREAELEREREVEDLLRQGFSKEEIVAWIMEGKL